MSSRRSLADFLPILRWDRQYRSGLFQEDALAALIVGIMIIPQALAYAMVAGMSPVTGLYTSIIALGVYALFGSSNTLSVGPVAVISLMTAAALGKFGFSSSAEYAAAALLLAFLSGAILLVMGLARLGVKANFLSQLVISAFITASYLIIAAGQLKHVFGIEVSGNMLPEMIVSIAGSLRSTNFITLCIGLAAIVFLPWSRTGLIALLHRMGVPEKFVLTITRTSPLLLIVATSLLAWGLQLDTRGVPLLGEVQAGLPGFTMPAFSAEAMRSLLGSALLIAIIGFVESISVAQSLAARRRERIDVDQELLALGASNIAVSFGGGFPVTGGFARSVVNFEAGAATPAAGLFTAILVALVALYLTPLLFWLPEVTLAAIILVAVLAIVDFTVFRKCWAYSKADFIAASLRLCLTLLVGVEFGIAAGVIFSILIHLYKTSRPHVAVVGRVAGTEHFRNINRHKTETFENLLSIRIDESMYFSNTRYPEEMIFNLVAEKAGLEHVILMCTAVNDIDMSALETLQNINDTLLEHGIKLHLSEVKGPIMDRLTNTEFFRTLSGNCYRSHNQAVEDLNLRETPLSGL